jgi:hypothetical protein
LCRRRDYLGDTVAIPRSSNSKPFSNHTFVDSLSGHALRESYDLEVAVRNDGITVFGVGLGVKNKTFHSGIKTDIVEIP